jgi:hypothetical protein
MIRHSRFATATKTAVVAALIIVAFSAPARAAAIIDFSTGYGLASGGTLTVDSTGNVVGSGIAIDILEVSGTTKDGTYNTSGTLSFDTAKNLIQIVGSVSSLGIYNQVLLWGTISTFDFDTGLFGLLGGFTASGPDSKSPQLLTALGLPTNTPFEYFGFSIGFDRNPLDNNHTYRVLSADIVNTQVPEPSTLALLGTALAGLAGTARRRLRR